MAEKESGKRPRLEGGGNGIQQGGEQKGLRPRPTGQQKPPPPTGGGSPSSAENDK
jgi:hypothetical protein